MTLKKEEISERFETIGVILRRDISDGKIDRAINALKHASQCLSQIFEMATSEPDRYSVYFRPNPQSFQVGLKTETTYDHFSVLTVYDQLVQAMDKAVENERTPLARAISDEIIHGLTRISQTSGMFLELRELLYTVQNQSMIKVQSKQRYRFIYERFIYTWYGEVVMKEKFIANEFWGICNEALLRGMCRVVDLNLNNLFENWIEEMTTRVYGEEPYGKIQLEHVDKFGLERQGIKPMQDVTSETLMRMFLELKSKYRVIANDNKLQDLKGDLDDYFGFFKDSENIEAIKSGIISTKLYQSKKQVTSLLCLEVLAYALHQNKTQFIETALFYNNPPGNRTTWANEDVFPETTEILCNWLIFLGPIPDVFNYPWKGHNDKYPFIHIVVIFLFFRAYIRNPNDFNFFEYSDGAFSEKEQRLLSSGLKRLAQEFPDATKKWNLVFSFIADYEVWENFQKRMKELTKSVDENIDKIERNKKMDSDIKEDFKKHIREALEHSSGLIPLLYEKYSKAIEITVGDREKLHDVLNLESTNSIHDSGYPSLGINTLLPKEPFTANQDPSVTYFGFAPSCAEEIASNINEFLIQKICQSTEQIKISSNQLTDYLESCEIENPIYIGLNFTPRDHPKLIDHTDFSPYWESQEANPDVDRLGFQGTFRTRPIYFIRRPRLPHSWQSILVVDEKKMGLIERVVLNPDCEGIEKYSEFQIKQYTGDDELINDMIDGGFNFPYGMASNNEKIKYLENQVWIKYIEQLRIVLDKDYSAILVNID